MVTLASWALNGLEIELVASLDGGPFIQTSFFLNATEFDETLNAYIYTYNLDIDYQGETGFIEGYVYQEAYNDNGDLILDPAQNAARSITMNITLLYIQMNMVTMLQKYLLQGHTT